MTIDWAVVALDAATGAPLISQHPDRRLRTASVGKLLLLIETARQLSEGSLHPGELLVRTGPDAVGDSGSWQHLQVAALSVVDLCVLIGSVSDNVATNVLLRRVGLPAVQRRAAALGLQHTQLLDQVRDRRGPDHPWTLSTGSAGELAGLLGSLHRGEIADRFASAAVVRWLNGPDLSMVPAGWGLDPLAHTERDRDLLLRHKTGTDLGVRCDVGLAIGPTRTVAYAVLANWDPAGPDLRDEVLTRMRSIGNRIRGMLDPAAGPRRPADERR